MGIDVSSIDVYWLHPEKFRGPMQSPWPIIHIPAWELCLLGTHELTPAGNAGDRGDALLGPAEQELDDEPIFSRAICVLAMAIPLVMCSISHWSEGSSSHRCVLHYLFFSPPNMWKLGW